MKCLEQRMKRLIAALSCSLLVLVVATAAGATNGGLQTPDSGLQTPEWCAMVSVESAVLYDRMEGNAAAIQKVAKGDVLKVDMEFTGGTGHWYKVSTAGAVAASGYIRAEYLSVPSPPDTASWEYKPPPAASPEGA